MTKETKYFDTIPHANLMEIGAPVPIEIVAKGLRMVINPADQVNASVVLQKDVYERLKAIAGQQKRSSSKQIAFWVEERLVHQEEKIAANK